MSTSSQICPQCGGLLPPGRTEGLCPKCLIQQGLQSALPSVAPTESSARGGLPAFVAATPEELAGHFPQLEILELLGVGGMGAVYKARQASLDRIVALKVLPREVGLDPAFAERFTREAKALARLNHPHIVTIHDIGYASGLYYIVMEYIDGVNLRQVINQRTLTPQQALQLVPQLCEALQYAHDEGIVHRDIKPENILVDKRGRAKVADFGLAKMLGEQLLQHSLTATQQVMGTLRYMAPEQMLGARDVDHRADLYALGVVFYELLTGDIPLGRFPLPSEKTPCDARLDGVVLKALEREREQRYQQASEIKTDVEVISGSYGAKDAVKRPPSPARSAAARSSLTDEEFEAAADDVRGPAWGLIGVSVVQLLLLVLAGSSIFSIDWIWGPDGGYARPVPVGWGPNYLTLWLLTSIPFALITIPAAIQMIRLRSYEFAVIGSLLAMLPLGITCVFTLPLGLWSLLVLLKPQVRAAFRTRNDQRPARWLRSGLAEDEAIALSDRAFEAAAEEAAPAALAMTLLGAIQLLVSLALVVGSLVMWNLPGPRQMDPDTWPSFAIAGAWHAFWALLFLATGLSMRRLRNYEFVLIGTLLAILPVGLTWMPTAAIALWCLLVLMRPQVRAAFRTRNDQRPARWHRSGPAEDQPDSLSSRAFETAIEEAAPAALAMTLLGAIQLLVSLALVVGSLVMWNLPGPRELATDTWPGLAIAGAWHAFWALLFLATGLNARRLRNYEFVLIGCIIALLPVGVTWVVSAAFALWCLLVMMRPQVRVAFRTPQRDRPEAWRGCDAQLLEQREQDPAAFQRAYQRVQARCRRAGIIMAVMCGCDVALTLLLPALIISSSHHAPLLVPVLLIGVPLAAIVLIVWGITRMLQMRNWGVATLGAVLCIVPVTPLWMVRWLVGLYALLTLMRNDVRKAFALTDDERSPPHDSTPQAKPIYVAATGRETAASAPTEAHWTANDEFMALVGLVGIIVLAAAPFGYEGWGTKVLAGLVLVGSVCLTMAIFHHAWRTMQRNAVRNTPGVAYEQTPSWSDWWRERSPWFRQAVSASAMIGYLLCLVLVLSFESYSTVDVANGKHPGSWKTTVGMPTPWMSIERQAGETPDAVHLANWTISLVNWSVFYGLIALLLLEAVATMRHWESRSSRAALKTRGVLAMLALCMFAVLFSIVGLAA